jgi:hypothetical protein
MFVFIVASGAVIDEETEKQEFPKYIQILARDGVDLHKVTAKITNAK